MYYKAQVDNKTPSNTDFSRVTNDSELWAPLTPFFFFKSLLIRSIAPVTQTGLNGVYLGFVVRARVAGSKSGSQRLDRKSGEQLGL